LVWEGHQDPDLCIYSRRWSLLNITLGLNLVQRWHGRQVELMESIDQFHRAW
jgi:hypothetical protein